MTVTVQKLFEALEAQKEGSDHDHYWDKVRDSGDKDSAAIARE